MGDSGSPSDRLGVGSALTFDFIFNTAVDTSIWTAGDGSFGTGIGGGEDYGNMVVSFQSLGIDGEYSDLVAGQGPGGWATVQEVPEPMPLALMGIGLIGLGIVTRRNRKY